MPTLHHVALLTPDLAKAIVRGAELGLPAGPVETFPGEGTRECYLGAPEATARLLLLEPLDVSGPYARALARRGPGLHHIAINEPDLDRYLAGVRGWLLHPRSLETIARSATAWLARPGVGCLLEVNESEPGDGPPAIERLEVPAPPELAGLLEATGASRSPDGSAWLTVAGRRVTVASLVEAE